MIVFVLERENAVDLLRSLMGPTDPAAAQDTHPKRCCLYGYGQCPNKAKGWWMCAWLSLSIAAILEVLSATRKR